MKKYRFIGDPGDYEWNIELINGAEYDSRFELNGFMSLEETLEAVKKQDKKDPILKDWEEVLEMSFEEWLKKFKKHGGLIYSYGGSNYSLNALRVLFESFKK